MRHRASKVARRLTASFALRKQPTSKYGDIEELVNMQQSHIAERKAAAKLRDADRSSWFNGANSGGGVGANQRNAAALDYEARDSSGNGVLQTQFDELVHDAIVKYCPVEKDELRSHELYELLRREQPGLKFGSTSPHFGGVPFPALCQGCSYLRAFRGYLHFMRQVTPQGVTVGLAKYKYRESPSQDGVRQGPQPWKFHAHQLPPRRSPMRRRDPL